METRRGALGRQRARRRRTPTFDSRPEGIARDRWDVAIETVSGTVLVECGAIRERVSQELARSVFDAVKREIEARQQTVDRSVNDWSHTSSATRIAIYHSVSANAGAAVDHARQHEEQIGEPVEYRTMQRVGRRLERDHAALGAAADGARHMQRGAGRRAAGQNKPGQRRQLGFEPIDERLEPRRRRRR